MLKYIIIYTECGDLMEEVFDDMKQAEEWLEKNNYKAKLIVVNGTYLIDDYT